MADLSYTQSAQSVQIVDESTGNAALVDATGALKVAAELASGSTIKILGNTSGNVAEVDSSNRLLVSTQPITPISSTAVSETVYSSISADADTFYTITNTKVLTIQRVAAGSELTNAGSIVELWYDPNGNGTGMTIIDVIFSAGTSDQHDLNVTFTGNGTRRILMRRRVLGGGTRNVFGRWEGFEI